MQKKLYKQLTLFVVFSSNILFAASELKFSNLLSDDMVLQRGQDINCWGWAKADSEVEILLTQSRDEVIAFVGEEALKRIEKKKTQGVMHPKVAQVHFEYVHQDGNSLETVRKTTKAGPDGKWMVKLGVHEASYTPTFLAAKSGQKGVALKNLLIGEVWVACGQSNMRWAGRSNYWESHGLLPRAVRYASYQARAHIPKEEPHTQVNWIPAADGAAKSFSTVSWLFAKYVHQRLKVPVGIINIAQGGSFASEWCERSVLEEMGSPTVDAALKKLDEKIREGGDKPGKPYGGPANLYNARFHPIKHLNMSGVIYFQGENEAITGAVAQYVKTFPGVIESFRKATENPELPFGIITLQGMGSQEGYSTSTYSVVREIHLQTHQSTPNTGYIVGHDIGGGIHPNYKRPLSERAAFWALRDVYGVITNSKRIRIKDLEFKEDKAFLRFEEVQYKDGKWVDPKQVWPRTNDQNAIGGFMIAGPDQLWYPGKVSGTGRLDGPTTLTVSHPMVKKAVAVRYGWEGWSKGNLGPFHDPMPPYRSDDWKVVPDDLVDVPDPNKPSPGVVRYREAHQAKNRQLEIPLLQGVESAGINLAKRHANPKDMLIALLDAMDKLLENFDPEEYKELAPVLSQTAFHKIPGRYWREDRWSPPRRAKWSWFLERALRFETFPEDLEKTLGKSGVKSGLETLKNSIIELRKELSELPGVEEMTEDEIIEIMLPRMIKEKERLTEQGVDLRKMEREMSARGF